MAKPRRLAEALEKGEKFEIQSAGARLYVPVRAQFNIEHEREGKEEEDRISDQVDESLTISVHGAGHQKSDHVH